VKKVIKNTDDHLVIHDVASIALAGVLGIAGALATGSSEVGVLAGGVVASAGIGGMRIGPVRRGVNSAAIALTGKPEET
jgi:hypothetical protein